MSVELAIIGPQRPFVLETLEREFTVHKAIDAQDKVAALQPVAGRIRGVVTNAMAGPQVQLIVLPPLLAQSVDLGFRTLPAQRLLVIAAGVVVAAAAAWTVTRTRFGVWLRAGSSGSSSVGCAVGSNTRGASSAASAKFTRSAAESSSTRATRSLPASLTTAPWPPTSRARPGDR